MEREAEEILNHCKKILSGEEEHTFQKVFGKNYSERSIETPWVASRIKNYKFRTILDIGFSMSSLDYLGLLLELQKYYNIRIEAIDIINPERVKNRYPKEWYDDIFSIPIMIGDIRDVQLPKGKYDAVTCISTIEHIGFDIATINNLNTAFDRKLNPKEVNMNRPSVTNQVVLNQFSVALKTNGKLLISVPAGKGGPILLRDSLGYYCAEWEYNNLSWNEIANHPNFELIEQYFFKINKKGIWEQVSSINALSKQSASLKAHAEGCIVALLSKI